MAWMEGLLKSLEKPTVFVIDNASYHTILTEESRTPVTSTTKKEIITWLDKKKITYESDMLKVNWMISNRPK